MKGTPSDEELRAAAIQRLRAKPVPDVQMEDKGKIVEELAIQKEEFRMQNEELKSVQYELEATKTKYFRLYDLAPVGYLTLDKDLIIKEANLAASSLLGCERKNIIGRPLSNFISLDHHEKLYAYFRRLAPGKYQLPCTIKIQRKDGKEVVVHFESNLVLEDNEEGFRSVLTDVTDLIGAEEALKRANDQLEYKVSERTKDLAASKYQLSEKAAQLERSNDELQQFAYIASHDLQEPLRMVISYLTLLERKYESQLDDTAREYLHYAVMGGERMRGLIDDLLEYSSVEAKGVRFECVDMKAVVSRTIELLVLPIEENQAEINVFPLPAVIADQSQMVQVMQNLISNAIKFHGSERPIVTISSTRGPDEWIFSVKDNGIGLNMHYADRIFQVFQRLNNRDRFEGTGIGLAIVKKILERHGGRVWVESEEGKGAAFYFTIPLKP